MTDYAARGFRMVKIAAGELAEDTARLTAARRALGDAFSLSYDDLLDLEAVEQLKTLECISNEVGGELITKAVLTGGPTRDLPERAQPRTGAKDAPRQRAGGKHETTAGGSGEGGGKDDADHDNDTDDVVAPL